MSAEKTARVSGLDLGDSFPPPRVILSIAITALLGYPLAGCVEDRFIPNSRPRSRPRHSLLRRRVGLPPRLLLRLALLEETHGRLASDKKRRRGSVLDSFGACAIVRPAAAWERQSK